MVTMFQPQKDLCQVDTSDQHIWELQLYDAVRGKQTKLAIDFNVKLLLKTTQIKHSQK